MIIGLHHAGLTVGSMQRALDFYVQNFDMEIIRQGELGDRLQQLKTVFAVEKFQVKTAIGRIGDVYVEFFEFLDPPPPAENRPHPAIYHLGISHICLQSSDIEADFARLKDKMQFTGPPVTMPSGAKLVYGRDLDQNIIELLEIGAGVDFPSLTAK